MDMYAIIRELTEERDRLNRIIQALEEMADGGGPRTKVRRSRRGRKSMDEQARLEVSQRMKRYWAKRRAERAAGTGKEEPETI